MEQLKQKAINRIVRLFIAVFGLSVAYFFITKQNLDAISKGFITGLYISLLGLSLFFIVKTALSLRSKEALKTHFIKETDERKALILQKTSRMSMIVYSISLGLATCIAFFYNDVVFYTLFGVMLFMAIIKVILKIFYSQKY